MDKQFVIPVRVDERILNKLDFVSIKLQQGRSETLGKGLERLYSDLGRKTTSKRIDLGTYLIRCGYFCLSTLYLHDYLYF